MSPNSNNLEGLDIEINPEFISLKSEKPLRILSSATLNGGLRESRSILNYRVAKNFDHPDPEKYLKKKLEKLGLPSSTVGMMTAAEVKDPGIASFEGSGFHVKTIATGGVSAPVVSGVTEPNYGTAGTINAVVLIDGDIETGAMVDAIRTATEAKSAALRGLDLRDEGGSNTASGTATDAVVVACTEKGERAEFAGPVTSLGNLIGRGVREAVKYALRKCGYDPSRPLIKRLEERGLTFELLVGTARKAFVRHPESDPGEEIYEALEEELEGALEDLNVAALIISGLRLEEDGERGLIPGLPVEKFESDPVSLLADEILGMGIANYINGSKGVFEFVRIDRTKPGVLGELGPFLDDVIGGLIAGICSRTYERND